MDSTILRALVEEGRAGRRAALVTVVETKGSVPRHAGSAMLVKAEGGFLGTVGGGRGEAAALEAARLALAQNRPALLKVEMLGEAALGPDMICGGTSRMLVELIGAASIYEAAFEAALRGERSLLIRRLPAVEGEGGFDPEPFVIDESLAPRRGAPRLFETGAAETCLRSGKPRAAEEGRSFYDPVFPSEKLLILGGGHVGLAVAKLALELDFTVTVGDDRPEFVAPGRFPAAVSVVSGSYTELISAFPFDAATYVVIMTRGHLFDLECVRAALPKPGRYLGFIGSARKTRLLLEQLGKDGFDAARVGALYAPIGLDIEAETPEEIAVSVLAELIAVRHNAASLEAHNLARKKRRS